MNYVIGTAWAIEILETFILIKPSREVAKNASYPLKSLRKPIGPSSMA